MKGPLNRKKSGRRLWVGGIGGKAQMRENQSDSWLIGWFLFFFI